MCVLGLIQCVSLTVYLHFLSNQSGKFSVKLTSNGRVSGDFTLGWCSRCFCSLDGKQAEQQNTKFLQSPQPVKHFTPAGSCWAQVNIQTPLWLCLQLFRCFASVADNESQRNPLNSGTCAQTAARAEQQVRPSISGRRRRILQPQDVLTAD